MQVQASNTLQVQAPAPLAAADAQPASSNSLVQNGSINGIPVWAYGVMGMLAGLIVLSVAGRPQADLLEAHILLCLLMSSALHPCARLRYIWLVHTLTSGSPVIWRVPRSLGHTYGCRLLWLQAVSEMAG